MSSNNQLPNIVIAGFTGDRSGSMHSMEDAPSKGLFDWIIDQKKSVKDNSQVGKFFVSTFDDEQDIRINGENISETNVSLEQCKDWMLPRNMTKLYDSGIADLERLIQANEDYKRNMPRSLRGLDPKIIIVWACMTDGADNSSRHTMEDFKNKVKYAQDVHDIKCFFLGANQDAIMTGQKYGFSPDNSLTFGSSPDYASAAFRSASQAMRQVSSGQNDEGFTDSMRNLSAPSHTTNNILPIPIHRSLRQPAISGYNSPPSLQRSTICLSTGS
jgi:hypothetical protein